LQGGKSEPPREGRRSIRGGVSGGQDPPSHVRCSCIQDSAWVYPYDCEEFVALLKAHLRLGKDVVYAVVEEIGNDAPIRTHFKLPAKS